MIAPLLDCPMKEEFDTASAEALGRPETISFYVSASVSSLQEICIYRSDITSFPPTPVWRVVSFLTHTHRHTPVHTCSYTEGDTHSDLLHRRPYLANTTGKAKFSIN